MAKEAEFHAGDMVTWRKGAYPQWIQGQRQQLGDGPFRVVGVLPLDENSRKLFGDNDVHPQQVLIEVPGLTIPVKFSGNWFVKV